MISDHARDIILNNWEADKTVGHIQDLLAEIGEDMSKSQINGRVRTARKNRDPRAKRRNNAVYPEDF